MYNMGMLNSCHIRFFSSTNAHHFPTKKGLVQKVQPRLGPGESLGRSGGHRRAAAVVRECLGARGATVWGLEPPWPWPVLGQKKHELKNSPMNFMEISMVCCSFL